MIDGEEVEFGTAGYTMDNVFVLYDRATDSVWYPGENETLEAVAGERLGSSIRFLDEPDPLPLRDWLRQQPDSTVLLPSEQDWKDLIRPRMGLRFTDRQDAAIVRRVVQDGPAANAGIEPGDAILRLDGQAVEGPKSLEAILDRRQGGESVKVDFRRGKRQKSATLVLRPGRTP